MKFCEGAGLTIANSLLKHASRHITTWQGYLHIPDGGAGVQFSIKLSITLPAPAALDFSVGADVDLKSQGEGPSNVF